MAANTPTPAPVSETEQWHTDPDWPGLVHDEHDILVATVHDWRPPEWPTNMRHADRLAKGGEVRDRRARLIASAPTLKAENAELVEALTALLSFPSEHEALGKIRHGQCQRCRKVESARTLLARIEARNGGECQRHRGGPR